MAAQLTTVRLPMATMAEMAVDAVIQLVQHKTVEDLVVNEPAPALLLRASTGPPKPNA